MLLSRRRVWRIRRRWHRLFVDEDVRAHYELDSILTVVDARHILPHLDEVKPEGVENESVEQVAFADKILLN